MVNSMNHNTPIMELKGVGDKTRKLFEKLDIATVGDLLSHYPRDYETFEEPVPIKEAKVGEVSAVYVTVVSVPNQKKIRNLTILNVNVRDDSGSMQLTFFNMPFLKKVLKAGGYYLFRGLVQSRGALKIMEQPKMYAYEDYRKQTHVLQPRYALTKGLTNQAVQKAAKQALSLYEFEREYYPEELLTGQNLVSHEEALWGIHFPKDKEELASARRRLVFDEFFSFLFFLRRNKDAAAELPNAFPMFETADTVRFLEQMPFSLTNAQKKVWQELKQDMGGPDCMNRLIQGDVGSGKTIVAVLALLMCAANGYQGALMAPTEVLALQHFETISEYTRKYHLAFRPVLLVGSMTAKEKKTAYELIAQGEVNLIIGTHALIQEKVQYKSLALVVTDEQHRFGVRQREHLADKGTREDGAVFPHVLVMSATPIPRTLAIILYGDLHISVIDELPANRLPIKNCVVNTAYRPKAYAFIEKEVAAGRQAYVICPQVEEGELEDVENVVDYTGKLRSVFPSGIQVAYLHGKMHPSEKNRIMQEFADRHIDVLVSTTVIEVGINVPNATVMMVENAERFGLAQLHQLRGRVGRGEHQSYCIFISAKEQEKTMERLQILNRSNDGFFIASEDLKLRGPGELFGIRQSGEFSFELGDIYADAGILKAASEAVDKLFEEDYELEKEEHLTLKKHFLEEKIGNCVDFRTI
ncbi:MAG: ATP-dependent DNA helicase RecG [Lachnoclostridium sp.]|nr:ATP-dependent DNA helicase RecG [Lachnospira sp.]MCM1248687.1 ATP-dependent DNA helicase RecG [Lachnoclostridium sp.]MCM1534936.1 ATP-dependent DNA helicase RecG [Clostridium sp.]